MGTCTALSPTRATWLAIEGGLPHLLLLPLHSLPPRHSRTGYLSGAHIQIHWLPKAATFQTLAFIDEKNHNFN